ncbi:MAG: hypothetical protein QXJ73_03925 [Candidatus Caldarchaeum sp.]
MNKPHPAALGLLLPALAVLLGHGYDLLVSYVAARNIVQGLSPYAGGEYPNPSYPSEVQGIGETPLWPLYLSTSYLLSSGDLILFNALTKIPIILSLAALAATVRRAGVEGAGFYTWNPFVLMTTVAWGKPDVVAATLFIFALLNAEKRHLSALLLAVSLNIKPLALGALPALIAYHGLKKGLVYLTTTTIISLTIFFTPFILMGWSVSTTVGGLANWLSEVGGMFPLNIFEYFYGWSYDGINPYGPVVGVPWLAAILITSTRVMIGRPKSLRELTLSALVGCTVFLVMRPKVSEQNLILPFILMHLLRGRPVSGRLWASVVLFSVLNYSVPQLLYPLWPSVAVDLFRETWMFEGPRLIARFVSSIIFYLLYFMEFRRLIKRGNSLAGYGFG